MTYPTEQERVAIQAFLGGYLDAASVVRFATIVDVLTEHFPTVAPVDGMMVSRVMRRLGFNKSHEPTDTELTYRRTVRPEEVTF